MSYDPKISQMKGVFGALDGAIAGVIAAAVIAFVKQNLDSVSPEMENTIAVAVGSVVSAVVIAAKRFISNWKKHKDMPQDQPQQ